MNLRGGGGGQGDVSQTYAPSLSLPSLSLLPPPSLDSLLTRVHPYTHLIQRLDLEHKLREGERGSGHRPGRDPCIEEEDVAGGQALHCLAERREKGCCVVGGWPDGAGSERHVRMVLIHCNGTKVGKGSKTCSNQHRKKAQSRPSTSQRAVGTRVNRRTYNAGHMLKHKQHQHQC